MEKTASTSDLCLNVTTFKALVWGKVRVTRYEGQNKARLDNVSACVNEEDMPSVAQGSD